ncbi:MAG: hypothetical protein A2705_00655 [Omnitrophica WOR_2 bacterium RIFCSPHIGHO2_01_FULL_52_10]|nr:MAG: hypothetical protein A2705_00655 [Omnitrophica WOR_2 bacterium RIFCSPHIGHO2_01_FULL_52_10]
MSKLLDALNKVKEERQRQSGHVLSSPAVSPALSPLAHQDQSGIWRIGYGLTAVLLVVAVTGSVFVNFKTMAGLESAKTMSLALSRHMDEQKQELVAIRQHWMKTESVRKDQREQIVVLQKDIKSLKKNLAEAKFHLAKIEDLRVNDKLLLEKFVALNDKVKKLSEKNVVNGE